jgi:Domain of unknown function (DUF222)/HNH endonuclease
VVPLERLEAQICELAGHLTAATCRFLLLVADFDARRGWESWDLPSCSAWLAWKCQLSPGTAREQVRVARALGDLPVIRAGFAAGQLSYAKVRALTRIATPATEEGLAELAGPMTGGQLERFVRAHRQVSRACGQRSRGARRVTWRVDDEDGSVAMTVRLPAAEGQVLVQALRATAATGLDHQHDRGHDAGVSAETPAARPGSGPEASGQEASGPEAGGPEAGGQEASGPEASGPAACGPAACGPAACGPQAGSQRAGSPMADGPEAGSPEAVSLADALVGIAADYLAGKIAAAANPDLYQVIVHVGPEALSEPGVGTAAAGVSAETPAAPGRDHARAGGAEAPPAGPPAADLPAPGHDPAPAGASAEASTAGTSASACAPTPGQDRDQTAAGASAEASTADPPAPHASDGASAEAPAAADPADSCRADCPYRQVGHPAHPRRCHLEDGPAISPATAQRIACTATISWMLHDHDGTLLDIGRRHRKPTAALRRAVRERDQYRCRFPGCRSRRTDLHHIRHWARGGKTSYWNLISLCEAHHVIVHDTGYLITADDGGTFTFTRPDGTIMPASPAPPPVTGDITTTHDADITPQTINTPGDRLDLHLAIWAAFANARIIQERAERERSAAR